MAEYVEAKQAKLMRVKGNKKPKVFRNYIKVMRKLCKANKVEEQVGLWLQLFAWMVMTNERIVFSKDTVRSSMGVEKYVEDVGG